MQCVILAAGKGTRMQPLTLERPKPLVEVCGKPLIEHIVAALPEVITELIIVVGYKAEMIKEYCGTEYMGRQVSYCDQNDFSGGTGDALKCAASKVTGTFLFMYADDIHGAEALERVCAKEHAVLAMKTDEVESFGILKLHTDGTLAEIVEKPKKAEAPSDLANISGWVVSPEIFNYDIVVSPRGELEATDMITAYARDNAVEVVEQDSWIPVGKPEDIATAEARLCP